MRITRRRLRLHNTHKPMIQIIKTECCHKEMWKQVEGYDYEVSSHGKLRNMRTGKLVRMSKGYGMRRVVLHKHKEFHLVKLAKLVLEAFVCKQPAGYKPFCLDGNYEHLYVENLVWVVKRRKSYKYKRVRPKRS